MTALSATAVQPAADSSKTLWYDAPARSWMTAVNNVGEDMRNGGGVYPNLFDAHPPFQIDGNFGAEG